MLVIRLSRTGANQRPFYHIVAMDHRKARDSGSYIERLGYYNPMAIETETALEIDQTRVDYWLSVGAQPSDRVKSLLRDFKKGQVKGEKHEAPAPGSAKARKAAKVEAEKAAAEAAPAEAAPAPAAEEPKE